MGEDVSGGRLDACDVSCRPDEGGKIEGDGARPAAYVEDVHVWFDVGEEVGCGVLGGAPAVGTQDGFMMPVCVDDSGFWHC